MSYRILFLNVGGPYNIVGMGAYIIDSLWGCILKIPHKKLLFLCMEHYTLKQNDDWRCHMVFLGRIFTLCRYWRVFVITTTKWVGNGRFTGKGVPEPLGYQSHVLPSTPLRPCHSLLRATFLVDQFYNDTFDTRRFRYYNK